MFAPLARLLGLYSFKEELEELAFSYSEPEQYARLKAHLAELGRVQGSVVQAVRHYISTRDL